MSAPHINELREHLMETLKSLRDRDNPMDPARAKAIAEVAGVMVDTAKVEVDYLRATGQDRSGFLEAPADVDSDSTTAGMPAGITGRTVHRLR